MKPKMFILAILFVFGCSKKTETNITDGFIRKIAVIHGTFPSKYIQYNLYVETTHKNSIFVTNVNFLNLIYKNHYQNEFKDFYTFLQAVLKQGYKLDIKNIADYEYHIFNENSAIMKLVTKEITEKYFRQSSDKNNIYFYPKELSTNDTQTILYKMFLEGYLISFDDYGGKYIIKKYQST